MAVTYGFYNSINYDRMYNAIQMSQIFDGVINDGVYMSVLNHLAVRPGEGMNVIVGGGRAWFNHTWTYNDQDLIVKLNDSELNATRIDAIVLEIDQRDISRANAIKVIKGTPAVSPSKPEFPDGTDLFYHPLAYITIRPTVTSITAADIENCIGVDPRTPFVTGIIETIDATELIAQWGAQWDEWNEEHRQAYLDWVAQQESDMETWTADQQQLYLDWVATQEQAYENWVDTKESEYDSWVADSEAAYNAWITNRQSLFLAWFDRMKDQLSEDAAGHLQNEIDDLYDDMDAYKEETSAEITEQTFKLAHDLCNRVTNIEYENGSISQITSTNSDYSAVSVTTFEDTAVGKNITTAVTKDGWVYTETVVINNDTHTITESYTKEEVTP